jgi:hypothetical protein
MRLYLYNYAVDGNWEVTLERSVVGIPHDATGMDTKATELEVGDVVVIHDNTWDYADFRVFGACLVAGPVLIQRLDKTPWKDLLWKDEVEARRVIYPFRFAISVANAPAVGRKQIAWEELDNVRAFNVRGGRITGKSAWGMKWRGNLLRGADEVRDMSRLLMLRWPQ